MPKISYITALDIYMLGCISFICLSLLEYGLATNIRFARWKERRASLVLQTKNMQRETRKSIDFTNFSVSVLPSLGFDFLFASFLFVNITFNCFYFYLTNVVVVSTVILYRAYCIVTR